MKKTLVSGLLVLALTLPIAASAQSTDLQSQIIALLTQVISLQKQVIEGLNNQITQLQARVSQLQASQPPIPSLINTHTCSIINPPACSTTLTVTRDSYNCVIGYSCKAATATESTNPNGTNTNPTNTGASCQSYS